VRASRRHRPIPRLGQVRPGRKLVRSLCPFPLISRLTATPSYGTVIATHLLHSRLAPKISHLVLVDPVVFLLHLPDVAYNFVSALGSPSSPLPTRNSIQPSNASTAQTYRPPRRANERQLAFFASRDPDVAHTLGRHFFWAANILWREELWQPDRTSNDSNDNSNSNSNDDGASVLRPATVALSARDLIVDAEGVGRYLAGSEGEEEAESWKERVWTGRGVEIVWLEECDHAQGFEKRRPMERLVEIVRGYAAQGRGRRS
jgi:hypothetical protein